MRQVLLLFLFRSPDCFELGWPLRLDHDFFHVDDPDKKTEDDSNKKNARFRFRSHKKVEERKTEGNEDTEPVVNIFLEFFISHCKYLFFQNLLDSIASITFNERIKVALESSVSY